MRSLRPLLAAGLALAWTAAAAAAPRLEAVWSTDSLTLGDPVRLTLAVEVPEEAVVSWPDPDPARLRPFDLLGADAAVSAPAGDGRRRWSRSFVLAPFAVGELAAPAPAPLVDGAPLAADSLRRRVLSLLPAGEEAQPAPLIGPRAWPVDWRPWALGGLLLALLAALAWRLWTRRPRREAAGTLASAPPPDPWTRFERALAAAETDAAWRRGDADGHWAALSLALRGWLEDESGLPCREWTTDELRAGLPAALCAGDERRRLLAWLEEGDRVKYARHRPDAAELSGAGARARAWAQGRRERLRAEAAAGEEPR